MMTGFNDIGSVFQILLLVLSQLTVFTLVCTIVFMYRRGSKKTRILGVFLCFVLNTVLYVLMQVNSRITEMEKSLPLDVPYSVLFAVVVLSLMYNVYTLVGETQGRKTINRNSIKEAFDIYEKIPSDRMNGIKGIGFVEFNKGDIVRHELVKHIVEAFDKQIDN